MHKPERSVYKFGGSSVRDAEAIERCCQIVLAAPQACAVVVSATFNTTNQLEALFRELESGDFDEFKRQQNRIVEKHLKIFKELGLKDQIDNFLVFVSPLLERQDALFQQKDSSSMALDEFYSLGELMSSWIFHAKLSSLSKSRPSFWADARTWLKTNSDFNQAEVDLEQTSKNVNLIKQENKGVWVTQGFMGSDSNSRVTTLGREGSDYSATLLAEMLKADEAIIWTDVDGIYSADPRLVPNAQRIKHLSYAQAQLMAESGAKVLYPRTLTPARRADFKVRVKNSLVPQGEGTWIDSDDKTDFFAVTQKRYDQANDLVTAIFPESLKPCFEALVREFKILSSTPLCWQGVVPVSVSQTIAQDIHEALSKSSSNSCL